LLSVGILSINALEVRDQIGHDLFNISAMGRREDSPGARTCTTQGHRVDRGAKASQPTSQSKSDDGDGQHRAGALPGRGSHDGSSLERRQYRRRRLILDDDTDDE
jgi:hypothetical protein